MDGKLIPAERHRRILEHLKLHQVVRISGLAAMLGVSEATIRRDLEQLDARNLLERTHGGAILSQSLPQEPEYGHSAQAHPAEKRVIGARAAELVEDGEIVFVNSGTTTTQVVRHLQNHRDVTVFTNNVRAVREAREAGLDVELVLLGGTFRYRSDSVAGAHAVNMLGRVHAARAFIGVDGISLRNGCTTPTDAEAEIARVMIERTRGPVIVVADHSKWGVVSNFELARLDQLHTLVTDEAFDAAGREALEQGGIEVHLARPARSNPVVARIGR